MSAIVVAQSPTTPAQGGSALDSSEALQHLASTYAAIAPFDLDGDGEFGAVERTDLLGRLENGTVPLMPFRMRPGGTAPPSQALLPRVVWVYAMTRPFDSNRDQTLDEQEQQALEAVLACRGLLLGLQPSAGCAGAPWWLGHPAGWPRAWGPRWR